MRDRTTCESPADNDMLSHAIAGVNRSVGLRPPAPRHPSAGLPIAAGDRSTRPVRLPGCEAGALLALPATDTISTSRFHKAGPIVIQRSSKIWLRVLVLLGLWAGLCPADEPQQRPAISAMQYLSHVQFLASDELAGRDVGTVGIDAAADYIAERLERLGLAPGGEDGSYFQPFEVRVTRQTTDEPSLEIEPLDEPLRPGSDFVVFPSPTTEPFEGPVAFVGYGVSAPEYDYDDYQGFDATGKVLLMFRYEPHDADEDAEFGGEKGSEHAWLVTKARRAREAGAAAVLIVNPPRYHGHSDHLAGRGLLADLQGIALPMMQVKRKVAEGMLETAGLPDLRTLQRELDRERRNSSEDLPGVIARGRGNVTSTAVRTRNVIGVLPGDGPLAEEYVVFGAHYDHVGVSAGGYPGLPGEYQFIHNGADDNASGTAGIIELARRFSEGPRTKRSLMFILFSAEERGLLGSRHFVQNPTVPLDNIVAMINADMIGRMRRDRVQVFGVGSAAPWRDMVKALAEPLDLHVRTFEQPYASDHLPFYRRGIPAVMFHTGLHAEYHRPADDWQQIDAEGAVRIVELMYQVGLQIADDPQRLVFTGEIEGAAAAAKPEKRAVLGIVAGPDQGDAGVPVDQVVPDAPAEKAGILDGDRIVQLGDVKIKSFDDLQAALEAHTSGDTVEVVVVRRGERITVTVTLGG
jgi:hypothetical protein